MTAAAMHKKKANLPPEQQPRKKEKKKPMAPGNMSPPMTPMIDVVFQLLLFFLLGCTFKQNEGQVEANLPAVGGPAQAAAIDLEPVKVRLTAIGQDNEGVQIEIGDPSPNVRNMLELYEHLMQRKVRYGDEVPVLISPMPNVRWEHVVNAFNQAVRCSFKNIGFAPQG